MGSIAQVSFFNLRGDILLERRYRDDVTREIAENFRTQILNAKEIVNSALAGPVRTLGSCTFAYLRHSDIYLLCVTKGNPNIMLAFKFMTSLVSLFKSYFEGELCEISVKNNFVLMYELLDEAMDFGLPQITDPSVLKSLIFQKGFHSELLEDLKLQEKKKVDPNATLQVTGAVSWRREGIKHKKNQVFLDLIEQVNLLMSSNGTILRSEVAGRIVMKCFLSDMPELRIGLNDGVEDATFHQCVNLSTYESQKVVTFVPPDGEFELMRYRQDAASLPFKVLSNINEMGRTRLELNVQVKANFSSKIHGTGIVILVPVPENTAKANLLVTLGKAKYDATKKSLVWKISKFMGEAEHSLRAEVILVATTKGETKHWVRPPISMTFQVHQLSASNIRIAYLKILERKAGSSYNVEKWVRKVVKSGDYLTRI